MIHIQGAAGDKPRRPLQSRNKKWSAGQNDTKNGHISDGERWERGGHRRRGRGRGNLQAHFGSHLTVPPTDGHDDATSATEDEGVSGDSGHEGDAELPEPQEPEFETAAEREKFYQELLKQREIERKKAIAEGKMDDPLVPKRLEDAITMVGTCMDMCPRFERYRRQREKNLDKWEVIPGTKLVDHKRAVKIYERAAGDKTLPSDLRPPPVLKKTLNYLFHDLLVREGFAQTYDFIRDRSRAVRNDFTMQHETGPLAIECHDRCARFHILALHLGREVPNFDVTMEDEQLMKTLQSLKEFYEDQRGRYQAPTELEMRVYHRLIHIRDQVERPESIPDEIKNHPVFKLTTEFRVCVQRQSAPISKTSKLVVNDEAMQIFAQLAGVLREQNNVVMIYLVACIIERLFGKDCIDDIEAIRGDLSIPEIIDGISRPLSDGAAYAASPAALTEEMTEIEEDEPSAPPPPPPQPVTKSATEWLTNNFGTTPSTGSGSTQSVFSSGSGTAPPASSTTSAFSNLGSQSMNAFGASGSAFSGSAFSPPAAQTASAFGNLATKTSVFGGATFGPTPSAPSSSAFSNGNAPKSVFGASSSPFGTSTTSTSGFPATPTSLTAQPTWPAESSSFGSGPSVPPSQTSNTLSTTPAQATPPKAHALKPFAPSFNPPQGGSTAPSPAFPSQPPSSETPIFSSIIFSTPVAGPSKPPASGLTNDIFNIPLVAPKPAPAGSVSPVATEAPTPEKTPPPPSTETSSETPSRLLERRQTLWDLPGSSSPFSRLKEEKMTYTPPPGSPAEPRTPISPTAPPPGLGRVPNIALPPTPTARWFDPSSHVQESDTVLSRKRSLLHFPSLTLPVPMTSSDILSPIHVTTPTPGKSVPAASGGPSPLYQAHLPSTEPHTADPSPAPSASGPSGASPIARTPSGPKPVLGIQTNGFASSPSKKGKDKETQADLDAKATQFLCASLLVRRCWASWREKREKTKAWAEACKRSDQYQSRVQRPARPLGVSQSGGSIPSLLSTSGDARAQALKKRRISVPSEAASAQARRLKRRKSNPFAQPLTDDALAQRLQENYAENEKRWAQGSFRQTVLKRLKSLIDPDDVLPEWCVWLSVNTENDKTAIWLEHKFDVPSSGYWVSESVFSIPAYDRPEGQGSPGLIVFERTPLEGVDDEIERKYRVLDDCARLRDIIGNLPATGKRHYTPCLLVINWSENDEGDKTRDLVDMTHKLVHEGVIKHVSYFNVSATAKELDKKFADILEITPLDTEDLLSVVISWKDIRRLFIAPVESTISDLLDTCWSDDFDWVRYDRVLSSVGEILNSALRAILGLFNDTPSHVSVEIPEEIQQPGILGRGYATGQFSDALARLLLSSAQELVGSRLASPIALPKDAVDAAVKAVERTMATQTEKLRQLAADAALRASFKSSPKRRAPDDDSLLGTSVSSKRMRPSPSDAEDGVTESDAEAVGFSSSPSPSATTDTSEKPIVTVAMLRALTRNLVATYGKKPPA